MKSNRTRSGMSMVEIMIVITIIATLAAILAYAMKSVRDRINTEQATQDLQRLAAAIDQLAFDTGEWPGHSARNATTSMAGSALPEVMDLTLPLAGLICADGIYSNKGWKGPYLDSVPLDPWGRKYFFDPDYRHANTGEWKAVVGSCGPKYSGANDWDADNIYIDVVPKLR